MRVGEGAKNVEERGRPLQKRSGSQTRDSQPRCGHLKPIKAMDYFRMMAYTNVTLDFQLNITFNTQDV